MTLRISIPVLPTNMMLVSPWIASVATAITLCAPVASHAAGPSTPGPTASPSAVNAHVIKLTPAVTLKSLSGRPDSDLVEFSDGKRMHVGELRRLSAWGQKVRSAPNKPFPAALRAKPAGSGERINDAADLARALKRSDNQTVRLPSGRLATVGQIKLVMPEVEKRLGHRLTTPTRAHLSGPAIKVNHQTDWKIILKRPDSTVLEAPDGQRITVGELKQALKKEGSTRRAPPTKMTPVVAPTKQR